MRGYILYGILSELALGTNLTLDVFRAILHSPYGASIGQLMKKTEELRSESYACYNEEQVKLRYYQLVYRLKRDGLIGSNKSGMYSVLTDKGKTKLEKLKKGMVATNVTDYQKSKKTKIVKLITFDIPEAERVKREWLRRVLLRLDFEMLQKSVWLGNSELPENFIADLGKLGIIDCVHILAVTKTGSVEKLN